MQSKTAHPTDMSHFLTIIYRCECLSEKAHSAVLPPGDDEEQTKSDLLSPEPSRSAPAAVKSPAKAPETSWMQPWSPPGPRKTPKVSFFPLVRCDSRTLHLSVSPQDWNLTACWKGRISEGPDYSWGATEGGGGGGGGGRLRPAGGVNLPSNWLEVEYFHCSVKKMLDNW